MIPVLQVFIKNHKFFCSLVSHKRPSTVQKITIFIDLKRFGVEDV